MNELNKRFKNYRISLNKTQFDVSNESGVSLRTIKKFESGGDIKLNTLNKLLKCIGYEDSLNNLLIDVNDRPRYKFNIKIRQRARKNTNVKKIVWGERK